MRIEPSTARLRQRIDLILLVLKSSVKIRQQRFSVGRKADANGEPLDDDLELTQRFLFRRAGVPCAPQGRSAGACRLVRSSVLDAQDDLPVCRHVDMRRRTAGGEQVREGEPQSELGALERR